MVLRLVSIYLRVMAYYPDHCIFRSSYSLRLPFTAGRVGGRGGVADRGCRVRPGGGNGECTRGGVGRSGCGGWAG